MRCAVLCACALLVATGAYAQAGSVGGVGPQAHPWKATKAQFDTYSCVDGGPFEGVIVAVTDAADTTTCPPGSTGTSTATCQCVDGTWTALAGGGGADGTCLDAGVDCLFAGSATEGGPATSALSVAADSVALTTDTTGNYVASITSGAGITGGDGGSEGAALTIAATLGTEVEVSELTDGTPGQLITWDADGVPATVATGGAGEVLTSNGAGAAPTFQAAAGGGSSSGTGLQYGDGAGGFSEVTSSSVSGANVTLGGSLALPQVNDATSPELAFGDGDTGLYESADDMLRLSLGGSNELTFIAASLYPGQPAGIIFGSNSYPWIKATPASSTLPTLVPMRSDPGTGIGRAGAGDLRLIASGVSGLGVTTTAVTNYRAILQLTPQASAPATCSIGDLYVDTSGELCACTSTNTWSGATGVGSCA